VIYHLYTPFSSSHFFLFFALDREEITVLAESLKKLCKKQHPTKEFVLAENQEKKQKLMLGRFNLFARLKGRKV